MSSSDFKNFLEKDILTYTKGAVEKNFEKVILTFGWSLKPSILKKKSFDLAYIIHSGFISGYQNRYGDNLKPPTNVYHRMTA